MDDTNSTDDRERDRAVTVKLEALIDSGKLQVVKGIAPISRRLGMSAARTKQALEAGMLNALIPGTFSGGILGAWQNNNGRWIALARRDHPQQESVPPAADQDGSDG